MIPISSQVQVISWPPVVQKGSPEAKCVVTKLPKVGFTLVLHSVESCMNETIGKKNPRFTFPCKLQINNRNQTQPSPF